jgi:hypothetical protein
VGLNPVVVDLVDGLILLLKSYSVALLDVLKFEPEAEVLSGVVFDDLSALLSLKSEGFEEFIFKVSLGTFSTRDRAGLARTIEDTDFLAFNEFDISLYW